MQRFGIGRANRVLAQVRAFWIMIVILAGGAGAAMAQPVISGSFSSTSVNAGGSVELTYSISNPPGSPADDLEVSVALPANLLLTSSPVSTCQNGTASGASGDGSFSLSGGQLAPEATCSLQAFVASSVAGSYTVSPAALTSSLGSASSDEVSLTVSAGGLIFSKAMSRSTINVGETVRMTYTFDNTANAAGIGSLSFTETLPSGLVIADAPNIANSCGNSANFPATITANAGSDSISYFQNGFNSSGFRSIEPGETCTFALDITGVAGGVYSTISDTLSADSSTAAGSAAAQLTVLQNSLSIAKSYDGIATPDSLARVTYTLTNNTRPDDITAIAFSDDFATLSPALAGSVVNGLVSNGCGGTPFLSSPQALTYSGGTLASGASCTVVIDLFVPASATPATYTNQTADVTGTLGGAAVSGNGATATLTVQGGPAPNVTNSFTNAVRGGTTDYTVTISNPSSAVAMTDIAFNTSFLTGIPLTTASATPGADPCGTGSTATFIAGFNPTPPSDATQGSLRLSGGSLAAGASCTFTVTLDVPDSAPSGSYDVTSGAVTATSGGSLVETPGPTATLTVTGEVNLSFSTSFVSGVAPGGTTDLVFDLLASAENPVDATSITFTDDLSAMLAGVTANIGSATNSCGGNFTATGGGSLLTLSGATLAPGASCQITVPVTVPAGAASASYTNTTSALTASDGSTTVTFPAATADLTVSSVSIDMDVATTPFLPGALVPAQITLTNDDPVNAASSASFSWAVNSGFSGLAVENIAAAPNTCGGTLSGTTFAFLSGGTIAAGSSCTIDLSLRVPVSAADGNYGLATSTLTATVNGAGVTGNFASARLLIETTSLAVTKTFSAADVVAGGSVTVSIAIENTSTTSPATGISISDDLDTFISGARRDNLVTPTLAGCGGGSVAASSTVSITANSIVAGGTCTISFPVVVPAATSPGTYVNTTSTVSGTIDGVGVTGAAASASVLVFSADAPSFVKSIAPNPADAGGTTVISYTINNPAGGAALSSVGFTDAIGADLGGATASVLPGANPCGTGSAVTGSGVVQLTGGSLGVGESCAFDVTITVPVSAAATTFSSTTSDLVANGLTVSVGASASLTVKDVPPAFAKSYTPASITQGDASVLEYVIDNTASGTSATALAFTDSLPAGASIVSQLSNTCGGTATGGAGDTAISLSAGSVSAGASCTIRYNITSQTISVGSSTSSVLSTSQGPSTTAAATLTVTAAPVPVFAKAFAPSGIAQGDISRITFTVDNSASFIDATGFAFADTLPAGMVLAPTPGATNTCVGGMGNASAGAGSFAFSGATVAAGTTCAIAVNVRATGDGALVNTTDAPTSSLGTSLAASATLTVSTAPAPSVVTAFSPTTVDQGDTSTLTVTYTNTSLLELTNGASTTTFPASLRITGTPATTCAGASLVAVDGGDNFALSSITLAPGASCQVSGTLITEAATTFSVSGGDLTSTELPTGTSAAATLTATAPTAPVFSGLASPNSFVQGGDTVVSYTIDNAANALAAANLAFTKPLPAGLTIGAGFSAATTCSGGTLTAVAGASSYSLSGATVPARGSCTVSIPLAAVVAGVQTLSTGDLTSDFGNSGAGTVTFTVTPAPVPTFAMSLTPQSVPEGAESRLSLAIENVSLVEVTGLSSSLSLPAGVTVAPVPNITGTCAGASAVPSGGGFAVTITALPAGGTCDIAFNIVGSNVGDTVISTGTLTSSLGTTPAATATLNVTRAGEPNVQLAFSPASVAEGAASTLTVTLDNSANFVAASAGGFSSSLPANLRLATPANASGSCTGAGVSGSVTAPDAGTALSVSGITVAAGGTCAYDFDILAQAAGTDTVTVSNFASSLGTSGPGTASLTTSAAPLPSIAKVYAPSTITQGNVATLTYTLDNSGALVDSTGGAFSETLPANVTVATPSNATTTCAAGTVSVTAGGTSVSALGLSIAAGTTCEVSVDVTSDVTGSFTSTSAVLSTDAGDSATGATATLTVTAAPVPGFAKLYAPDTITQGETSVATYTLTSTAGIDATSVAFSDTLPTDVLVADPSGAATTCGGTLTAAGASIDLTGGTLAAGATCTVTVNVTSAVIGSSTLATGDLTSSLGNSGTASAALAITAAPVPDLAGVFAPGTITQGEIATLTYTIDNAAASLAAAALAFDVTLPTGVTVADTPGNTTTCAGGTLALAAGGSTMSFAGGTVDPLASCTVSFDVRAVTSGTQTVASGVLSSDLGTSAAASADLIVTGAPLPVFTKSFADAAIGQGDVTTLTLTIDTTSTFIDATAVGFTDPLPAGMTVASPPNASTTCAAGTLTAGAGANTISFAGGTATAATTCDVIVDVTSSTIGTATNVTGDLTSSLGNSGPATASVDVNAATAPGFAKAYSPSTISESGLSTLTWTIDNTANIGATALAFSDTLPAGVTIASVPNASATCTGGTITGGAGATSLSYTGGDVAAATICTVQVDVTSVTLGTASGTSGDLTSSLGNSGTATAALTVEAATVPLFTSQFAPPQIFQGGTTNLIFTVDNSGNSIPVGGLGFLATLPANLTVSGAPASRISASLVSAASTSTCGGSSTAVAGSSTVSLAGGTVAPGSTCTVTVPVTSAITGTLGAVSATLTTSIGSATVTPAGSPLVVVTNPEGNLTIVQNSTEDATFTFTSTAAALNTSITTIGGTGTAGPLTVLAGTYTVTQVRPSGFTNSAVSCSDTDSTVDVSSGALTLVIGANEAVTCTFSSSNTTSVTQEVISNYLNRRNNLILSNGPGRSRRMERLSQGIGTSETLSFQRGDLKAMNPVSFNLLSLGSGSYSVSTSLAQAERAAMMFRLASDGDETHTAILQNRRYDVWFEAHYNEFNGSAGSGGHFGIAYLGADYLFTPDLLAGIMLQYDTMEDIGATSTVTGDGWMIGPYVTARLAPNLIFDGRLAYGQSSNDISPFNTYTDNFSTDRWLLDMNLSGNYDWKEWVITPNLNLSYIEDTSDAYVDSNNNLIPSVKSSLGQIKFGPTFSTSFMAKNEVQVQPSFTVNGIYNFGQQGVTSVGADETDGFRGRIEAAVKLTNRYGTRVELGANYDGIGQSDFEAWGIKAQVTIPLGK